jgi:hypothetical protein
VGYKLPVVHRQLFPEGHASLNPIGYRIGPWVETPVAIVQIDSDIVVDLRGNQLVFTG